MNLIAVYLHFYASKKIVYDLIWLSRCCNK